MSALSDTPTGSVPIACKRQLAYGVVSRRSGGIDEGADMHELIQAPARMRPLAALIAVLAAVTVAACDKPSSSQTAGQRLDSTMANAEQKANEAKDGAKAAAGEVAQSTERMAGEVSDKVKDAAITTAVNAKIAGDPNLSVMRINVDTVNGRVLLRGTAPDATASQRAQQLAATVEGVVGVDNQLVVSGKS
ncbi:MAG: BON domain-containing protein [Burkholderiales bacterium]